MSRDEHDHSDANGPDLGAHSRRQILRDEDLLQELVRLREQRRIWMVLAFSLGAFGLCWFAISILSAFFLP